ncbi:MAG: RbcX chaperonin protein [Leptolyngbyaceae cyanobacterium SM1_1_3]|nr:RbcX chaperonin protein [Leptolyngbyaceae cyanobacterium SM1_1_3]NJN04438.1 RbcX chaperonin protein [Leptolyngbyaceae cyanobacterium RM1_1_2]NJO11019.1 RbcX chaperonin protein [Leptolyngbyaceae cyanobacterium SL_1_1]
MDLKQIARDTAKVMVSYLTYQAVRTVLGQLRETNLPRSHWLNAFATREKLQDGEAFLKALLQAQPDLAVRVMTVRQHIVEEIGEFLPEMVNTSIQQSNIEHRRQYLERATQMTLSDTEAQPESENSAE